MPDTTPIPMSETLGLPSGSMSPSTEADFLRQMIAAQSNTTGLTQLGPNTGGAQPPAQRQFQQPGPQQTSSFGVGERGAHQRESMGNLVKASQTLANKFGEYQQAKQNREYELTIGRFTGATQGVAQAQAQVLQATQALKQNPNDPQAKQMLQQAQQALQQNQAILNDMANDKKAHKIITKAFGVDDKNAASPERAAAVQALQKQMGVGSRAAGIMSQLPQTQQLSPQGQQQEIARKAGVVGAPLSQGQALSSLTTLTKTGMTEAGKDKRAQVVDQIKATMSGQVMGADGSLRPMTPEEMKANPIIAAKVGLSEARQQLAEAQSALDAARTTALPEQVKIAEARVATLQGNLMMRQKEFGIKVQEEERKQLETAAKVGDAQLVNTPEGQQIDLSKFTGGRPLQSWAQQTVVQTQDRLQQVQRLEQKIKDLGLQDNNTPGYLATSRLGYAVGITSDEGSLAAEISNIELQRVVNAATILKGSSRAYSALSLAMIHTPNAWVDSPKLMLQKLQTIESNLNDMQTDAIQYGQKGERSGEMPHAAPKAAPAPPKAPSAAPAPGALPPGWQ